MLAAPARRRRRVQQFLVSALVAVLALVGAIGVAAPAYADDEVVVGVPDWSGLDVTHYAGPIPAQPGTLIAKVPLASALTLPAAGSAYRVQFSTVDQHNKKATSTGAVFLPKGTAPVGGWPVISWAHGTVGMNDDCTPSAFPRSARDVEYLGPWLQQGYAVVAADYVGLGTPGLMAYLDGKAAAHSIVDIVVASSQAGLRLGKKWAIIGQSQGAACSASSRGAPPAIRY